MKKVWPCLKNYLLVFAVIFAIGFMINLSTTGETLCVTDTWCPDRKEAALPLAVLFTIPFLVLTAFFNHLLPPIMGWIWKHPQHAFAGVFFFMAVPPVVLLLVNPTSILPIQTKLAYAAVVANCLLGAATIAFANSIPENARHKPTKKGKLTGVLLLLGLFLCMGLTVAAVSKW